MKETGLLTLVATSVTVFALLMISLPASSEASIDSSWRANAHGRSIDIDICIRCTSDVPGPAGPQGETGPQGVPGPQGPQGPAGDTHQTIVTLHDDAEGNAAGWNPGSSNGEREIFEILSPVGLSEEISVEATYVNTNHDGGTCGFDGIDTSANTFFLVCPISPTPVQRDGATLTYIITNPQFG